ncbi:sushi, von Willebrand factor type A, EGF and pentraxin domain-containing protein 1-like [Ruditapes philippinarum]|uniref:sushi, von Willebrand factor type A, EGF and pentraxin domain-containing protein 1-like n=1 Tax=Ruditapes philippinarum TaxID=129788 RepID=UPI00295C3028|nr:sushi, von Willebrand factor type A, EGF and pentraxin domain-containing protein 1-like [Ruditapes philippinarum]
MTGDTHVMCIIQESTFPVWSGNPACEAIQCGEPTKPINGNISCSTESFSYQSVCNITCETGFTADGPLIMICQANGSWSRPTFCTFPEPLAVHCISPQVFYTSPQQTSVQVHWQEPTSFALDSNLMQMRKINGPIQGDILDVGLHTVTYELTNVVSRETAECDLQLHVKVVLCEEPSTSLNDSFMIHQCSLPTLILGTNCIISCENGMELIGNSSVICADNGMKNGIWDWGHSDKPFCNNTIQNCTHNINDPGNGQLVYGENDTLPIVQVVCDAGFSLPLGFPRIVFCLKGKWEYDQIPNCIAEMKQDYKMKVEVTFNGQGCSDNALIYFEEYEETFKLEFENILIQNCSSETLCTVNDVLIECYNKSTQSAGKEVSHLDDYNQTLTQMVLLTFTLRVEAAENFSDNLDIDIGNVVKSLWGYYPQWVESTILEMLELYGDFVFESWNIVTFTMPTCIMQEHQCRTCSIGTFFNETLGICQPCPLGYYKDEPGFKLCMRCPFRTSTKSKGSYSIQDCKEICPPGSFSSNGLISCLVCQRGYYQDMHGQTECKKCPEGTTTILPNGTNVNNCTATNENNRCIRSSCNGHRCISRNGERFCVCSDGWSGDLCNHPPNYCSDHACMNGGTCINNNDSYICHCPSSFNGVLCEAKSEGGGWTEWSRWTDCSVACGNGSKVRTRQCTNPSPSMSGDKCVGILAENKLCFMDICKECSALINGINSLFECKITKSGSEKCQARCNDSNVLVSAFNAFSSLECGLQTGWLWLPVNISASCVEPHNPVSLHLGSSIEYEEKIQNKFHEHATKQVFNNLLASDCFKTPTCELNVTFLNDTSQNAENVAFDRSKLLVSFDKSIQYEAWKVTFEDNEYKFLNTVTAIRRMESTAKYLMENASDIFDIYVNDITKRALEENRRSFKADPGSLTINGRVNCLPGQAPNDGVCIVCPPGTYAGYDSCHLCTKDTFQPFHGQTRCIACPLGHTTQSVGSNHETQCVVCPPGTYAGYQSCQLCIKDTFQPFHGQTRCIACPLGHTTQSVGSNHETQCGVQKLQPAEGKDELEVSLSLVAILSGLAGAIASSAATYATVKQLQRNSKSLDGKKNQQEVQKLEPAEEKDVLEECTFTKDKDAFTVTDDMKAKFDNYGCILVRNFLSKEEVTHIKTSFESDEFKAYMYALDNSEGRETHMIIWKQPGDDITGILGRCEKVVTTCENLLGGEVYHYHSKLMGKPPKEDGRHLWHQDDGYGYENGCLYLNMITVFIAMDKCEKANGCLQYLPVTQKCGIIEHHRLGDQFEADRERIKEIQKEKNGIPLLYAELEEGDALFMHCNVLHFSSANLSDKWRWALLCCYNRANNNPVHHHSQYTPLKKVNDSKILSCKKLIDIEGKSFMPPLQKEETSTYL